MTPRMNDNLVKAFFFVAIFVVLIFQSMFTNAEPAKTTPFRFVDFLPSVISPSRAHVLKIGS
ncbi:MAG: hypothetical protein WEB30_11290 [Cyclobacteriaceae bacterium]